MDSAKQLTCPKSPNCSRFLEEIKIEGTAYYLLDATFTPFEITEPREIRVVHRSTKRVCANHLCAPLVKLPSFAR